MPALAMPGKMGDPDLARAETLNPVILEAHARQLIGRKYVPGGQRIGKMASAATTGPLDCVGVVECVTVDLGLGYQPKYPPRPWWGDPAQATAALLEGVRRFARPRADYCHGAVCVYRDGGTRMPHIGIMSGDRMIHGADYAGRVVCDYYSRDDVMGPQPRFYDLVNRPECSRGPDNLDISECCAVIEDSSEGQDIWSCFCAQILSPTGELLALTRDFHRHDLLLEYLSPIYTHIETVD